jgi:hypothetical protein
MPVDISILSNRHHSKSGSMMESQIQQQQQQITLWPLGKSRILLKGFYHMH